MAGEGASAAGDRRRRGGAPVIDSRCREVGQERGVAKLGGVTAAMEEGAGARGGAGRGGERLAVGPGLRARRRGPCAT